MQSNNEEQLADEVVDQESPLRFAGGQPMNINRPFVVAIAVIFIVIVGIFSINAFSKKSTKEDILDLSKIAPQNNQATGQVAGAMNGPVKPSGYVPPKPTTSSKVAKKQEADPTVTPSATATPTPASSTQSSTPTPTPTQVPTSAPIATATPTSEPTPTPTSEPPSPTPTSTPEP